MPKWRKSPPELIALFEKAITAVPEAETRKMFGYPAAFIGGNMFAGLHQENLVLKLPEADRTAFLKKEGAELFEPMPGRVMKEYVTVPEQVLAKPAELKKWLRKSLDYVSTLPPKQRKKKK